MFFCDSGSFFPIVHLAFDLLSIIGESFIPDIFHVADAGRRAAMDSREFSLNAGIDRLAFVFHTLTES